MQAKQLNPASVCAVVLAGGRATRMGGLDKGLVHFGGQPLAAHAIARLRAQQGGAPGLIAINANRNQALYASLGVPVWSDTEPDFAGPLAGFAAALEQCQQHYAYLLCVPCDSPRFPIDLLARLGQALIGEQAEIAMASAPEVQADGSTWLRPQPVFCLLRCELLASLRSFLALGGRKIGAWTAQHRQTKLPFNLACDDPRAFANTNTLDELRALEQA